MLIKFNMKKMKMGIVGLLLSWSVIFFGCNKMDALEETPVTVKDTTKVINGIKDTVKDTTKVINGIKDTVKVIVKDTLNVGNNNNTAAPIVTTSANPSINLVFDGDSQTKRGYYPSKVLALLKANAYTNVTTVNFGVSGQTTFNMISDVATQVVPAKNSKAQVNIVCYWIGANDAIKDASTDTAKLYKYLLSYYNTLHKAGFKVLMINLPDANHHVGTDKINAMYKRVYSKISDVYVNCRVTGGAFEKNTNLSYYTEDGIHLCTNGYNYLAEKYVYPKLIGFIKSYTAPKN